MRDRGTDRDIINHRDTAGRHTNRETGMTKQTARQADRQSHKTG